MENKNIIKIEVNGKISKKELLEKIQESINDDCEFIEEDINLSIESKSKLIDLIILAPHRYYTISDVLNAINNAIIGAGNMLKSSTQFAKNDEEIIVLNYEKYTIDALLDILSESINIDKKYFDLNKGFNIIKFNELNLEYEYLLLIINSVSRNFYKFIEYVENETPDINIRYCDYSTNKILSKHYYTLEELKDFVKEKFNIANPEMAAANLVNTKIINSLTENTRFIFNALNDIKFKCDEGYYSCDYLLNKISLILIGEYEMKSRIFISSNETLPEKDLDEQHMLKLGAEEYTASNIIRKMYEIQPLKTKLFFMKYGIVIDIFIVRIND